MSLEPERAVVFEASEKVETLPGLLHHVTVLM